MAAPWIPMRMDLLDDPAVIQIAAAVGLDEYGVVGRLHRLWSWANQQLRSGNAPGVTLAWLDRYIDAPGFAAAMTAAGWLVLDNGGVSFPNFDRWNSQGAKKRILATQRVQKSRSAECNAPSVTKARPEKRREEYKKEPPQSPPGGAEEKPPKVKPERPRNELFDAIAEVTGTDPKASGGYVAKVAKALGSADPPYAPAEVHAFAALVASGAACGWAARDGRTRPTLNEVEKYIGHVRNGPPPATGPPPRRSGFRTHDEQVLDVMFPDAGEETLT